MAFLYFYTLFKKIYGRDTDFALKVKLESFLLERSGWSKKISFRESDEVFRRVTGCRWPRLERDLWPWGSWSATKPSPAALSGQSAGISLAKSKWQKTPSSGRSTESSSRSHRRGQRGLQPLQGINKLMLYELTLMLVLKIFISILL